MSVRYFLGLFSKDNYLLLGFRLCDKITLFGLSMATLQSSTAFQFSLRAKPRNGVHFRLQKIYIFSVRTTFPKQFGIHEVFAARLADNKRN